MFKAVFAMKEIGVFDIFHEAFKAIYDAIKNSTEPLTWQVLETAVWIENNGSPITFYDARDIMCDQGYLVDGEWVEQ